MKCRVTIFLILFWALFSVLGYLGKDGLYKNYTNNVRRTPYFVLALWGFHDGIYPWSSEPADFWERLTNQADPGPGSKGELAGTADGTELPAVETETASAVPETAAQETETENRVREFTAVDESYFDDAVFIGDSRTVGLHDYGGLDHAEFYASVGLNVYDMWDEAFCEVDGEKVTLEDALSRRQFKKVYFQIGINEMGRGTLDSFMQAYTQSVQRFKELQPDAVIFVQGIMRVTKEKSESDPIFNNKGIQQRNERIAQLADNRTVFYIDMNEAVCDDTGNLKKELTFDNLHLYGSKYDVWVNFLLTKGIL